MNIKVGGVSVTVAGEGSGVGVARADIAGMEHVQAGEDDEIKLSGFLETFKNNAAVTEAEETEDIVADIFGEVKVVPVDSLHWGKSEV